MEQLHGAIFDEYQVSVNIRVTAGCDPAKENKTFYTSLGEIIPENFVSIVSKTGSSFMIQCLFIYNNIKIACVCEFVSLWAL